MVSSIRRCNKATRTSHLMLCIGTLLAGCANKQDIALELSEEYVRESEIITIAVNSVESREFEIEVDVCNIGVEDISVLEPIPNVNLFLRVPDELAVHENVWGYWIPSPQMLKAGECCLGVFDLVGHDRTFEGRDGRYEGRLLYHSNRFTQANERKGVLLITFETAPFYLIIRNNRLVRVEWQ